MSPFPPSPAETGGEDQHHWGLCPGEPRDEECTSTELLLWLVIVLPVGVLGLVLGFVIARWMQ